MKRRKNSLFNKELDPKPVIEVEEKHFKLRVVLLAVCIAVAIFSLGYWLFNLLNTEPGWREITVQSQKLHCGEDFIFQYNLGASGISATEENKKITTLYSQACQDAYDLFVSEQELAELGNLQHVNAHVNESVTVDPRLYAVFSLLQQYESRLLFLAPVYAQYDGIFLAENAQTAIQYDPMHNPEQMAYVTELMGYIKQQDQIHLELLGDNQVCLRVGQEYLAYAQENGIEQFLDFGWLANAFIADMLAQTLQDAGYTRGYLASYDGFTRNLDTSNTVYSQNVFDRKDNAVDIAAVWEYTGPMSIVFFRNYPLSSADRWHYRAYADLNAITTVYLDPADGVSKSATDNLLCYSKDLSCGEIALKCAPLYLTEQFREDAINALQTSGINCIWGEGSTICYNQKDLPIGVIENTGYTLNCVTQ